MRVREAMTRDVCVASPDQSIREAATMMAQIDAGILPVGEDDRLIGMLSDRDIAVRAVARGKGPETPIREVMTADIKYCFEDEDIQDIAENMSEQQIRRIPVMNRDKRLVGILSLGDLAIEEGPRPAGDALVGISQPGGRHCQ